MHINEVFAILKDTFSTAGKQFEIKKYNDEISCNCDFVLLFEGMEFAYIKYDINGDMNVKEMKIHEDKMGSASFYCIVKDSEDFIPVSLPCIIYPRNNMNHPFACDTSNIGEKLLGYHSPNASPLTIENVADFLGKTYSSLIRGRMQVFLSKCSEETNIENVIEDHDSFFMLTPKYEHLFLCSLLGSTSGIPKRICRYTTLSSLFRTLTEKRQSMSSLVCMNDKTESYYSEKFISEAASQSNVIQRLYARTIHTNSQPLSFILSGSRMSKKDDLNMWRLYGEDSKGVCLWYTVEDELPENFFLAKVGYGKNDTHAELTYLASKMGKSVNGRNFEIRNLNSWLHFFKPAEYAIEEEVRLLYEMRDIDLFEEKGGKWVLNADNGIISPIVRFPITKQDNSFPLILDKIVLGPNIAEVNTNKEQLQLLIKQCKIRVTDSFEVISSKVSSYRK